LSRKLITGKVAAVIVEQGDVVINRGSNEGVNNGMTFAIYGESHEIRDPDDAAKVLGVLRYRKATLKVSQVFLNMSLCRSTSSGWSGVLSPWLQSTLITSPGEKTDIKIGDPVEEVPEPPQVAPPPKTNEGSQ
jgi:hypothetical protein